MTVRISEEQIKMQKLSFLTLLLLVVGVSTALAQDVRYNFAQGEDFSKYKTYKWVSTKNAEHVEKGVRSDKVLELEARRVKCGSSRGRSSRRDKRV
jgi:hypothetical protein